ncbi:MAG: protein-L-isoaspartate(D-aspartate) O-methyltransferase [Acidithiobacillus ferriphilus]|uniref:Protein-L-isoaspartate O-methyltransferase n=1 Tax=Acidithiobacillus ferrivorans TaxID=160808 RepID=A0A257SNY0_9PROT|nr:MULTISPECIES: protein-L-isoaspartate(D-aspartate) O-methyltransferase [Acidithiobacillus]OYV74855.1 MAG: protein-L-isoaspartate O-methyltransferase [Acidithiobacillus ferrivorans]MBU2784380.1 protein-L-isoaspartate(D-aspartate) O-methyltransferase [Acidithiobacillus ferriphilus]MBU2827024.1 protein-L-isoaspartate(D-aspartate) O-methyltransferase [Acidithiobacillus ferriphilus]MBU2844904.1 protein-L-isoaspartate(D-aspartate) O-methyltransferase [Acidithiobacillus ferriphilus]MBU2848383.1 pro
MAASLLALSPEVGMISPRTRGRMVLRLRAEGIRDERVLDAMNRVPRHHFVAQALAGRAYEPVSLPIGYGQTISQPWTVARMMEAILEDREVPQRVLEIGTGSAYQTAVLAELGAEVFSIERIGPLQEMAEVLLGRLNYRQVHLHHGDGSGGWPEKAPFDAIVITAAVPCALAPLYRQLRAGGSLVMPVEEGGRQHLQVSHWDGSAAQVIPLGACHFVPLLAGTIAVASGECVG